MTGSSCLLAVVALLCLFELAGARVSTFQSGLSGIYTIDEDLKPSSLLIPTPDDTIEEHSLFADATHLYAGIFDRIVRYAHDDPEHKQELVVQCEDGLHLELRPWSVVNGTLWYWHAETVLSSALVSLDLATGKQNAFIKCFQRCAIPWSAGSALDASRIVFADQDQAQFVLCTASAQDTIECPEVAIHGLDGIVDLQYGFRPWDFQYNPVANVAVLALTPGGSTDLILALGTLDAAATRWEALGSKYVWRREKFGQEIITGFGWDHHAGRVWFADMSHNFAFTATPGGKFVEVANPERGGWAMCVNYY